MNSSLKEKLEQLTQMADLQLTIREKELEKLKILEQRLASYKLSCEAYDLFLQRFKHRLDAAEKDGVAKIAFTLNLVHAEGIALKRLVGILTEAGFGVLVETQSILKGDSGIQDFAIEISLPQS